MTDTTTEAVERLANNVYAAPMTYCADAREVLSALAAERDALKAEKAKAVAAALEKAINRVNGCDRVSEVQPAIRVLIAEYRNEKSPRRMNAEGQ